MIKIKSLFGTWREIDEETVRSWATYKLRAITTCHNDEERLALINNRIEGIRFSLGDLK